MKISEIFFILHMQKHYPLTLSQLHAINTFGHIPKIVPPTKPQTPQPQPQTPPQPSPQPQTPQTTKTKLKKKVFTHDNGCKCIVCNDPKE